MSNLSSSSRGKGKRAKGKGVPAEEVAAFHENADTDDGDFAMHHTLGPNPGQAAPGGHLHDGTDSPLLIQGLTVSGTRGSAAYYASLEAVLTRLGAQNTATGP